MDHCLLKYIFCIINHRDKNQKSCNIFIETKQTNKTPNKLNLQFYHMSNVCLATFSVLSKELHHK